MNENPPHDRKAFLEEAESLQCKGDHLTVLALAESRLKRTPGDMDARVVICRVWIEQGKLEEAGEMIREMEDIVASLSQIYTCMGDIYLRKGMAESAQVFYRTFVSLNPDTPTARKISERLEGISEQHAADGRERVEQEEAVQLPDDLQTVTLAELYARQGHLRMAEEILEAILGRGPHHPKAAELLREVRERIASQEEPEQMYEPEIPEEVREEIADQEETGEKSVAELLREIGRRTVSQEKPEAKDEPQILPALREGIASQEEPEQMYEPELPREADERTESRGKSGANHVVELLRELKELRAGIASQGKPAQKQTPVIAVLSRWLNNIDRLGDHAA
jgi:tetratricopeptide (TPR) repeat protein